MEVKEKITASSVSMDGLRVLVTYTAVDDENNEVGTFEKAYVISSGKKSDVDQAIAKDRERLENAYKLQDKISKH